MKDEILKRFRKDFKPGSLYDGEVTASTEKFESFLLDALDKQEKETKRAIAIKVLPALIIDEAEDGEAWYQNLHKVIKEALSHD